MERNIDNTLVLDKGSKRTRTISLPFNSEQVQVNQEERRLPGEGGAKGKGQSRILEGASSLKESLPYLQIAPTCPLTMSWHEDKG